MRKTDNLNNSVKVSLLFICLFVFYACGNNKVNEDRKQEDIEKEYYDNGSLKLKVHYKDSFREGKEIGFYKNGKIEHIGWYDKGRQDSIWVWYFNEDRPLKKRIKIKEYWKDGTVVGHSLRYYKNGRIKIYAFNDPLGRTIYKINYDSISESYNEKGMKKPNIIIKSENIHKFKVGDTLNSRIYAINPPKIKTELFVKIESSSGSANNNWKKLESTSYFKPFNFSKVLEQTGSYVFKVKLKYQSPNKEKDEYINKVHFEVFEDSHPS